MKNRIIHIAPDEKFIAAADWLFGQAFPKTEHIFYILSEKNKQPKHVKPQTNYHFITGSSDDVKMLTQEIHANDLVIAHYLLEFSCKLRLATHPNINFMWIMWGKDIFESGLYEGETLGVQTKAVFAEKKSLNLLKQGVKKTLQTTGFIFSPQKKVQAIKLMQFIGCPFVEDFEMFNQLGFFNAEAKPVRTSYYPLEFIFKDNLDEKVNGDYIQIGNSATATNNHLEVFDYLKKADLGNRKIIVPLSYGDKKYANYIRDKGRELFPNNFYPLIDFMPLKAYQKTMQACGIVVMNHHRKQATGNVISMLWMGAKLFINEKSMTYHFLKRIGCHIFSTERELSKPDALTLLSEKEITHNRSILLEHFSKNKVIENLRSDLAALNVS